MLLLFGNRIDTLGSEPQEITRTNSIHVRTFFRYVIILAFAKPAALAISAWVLL